MVGRASGARRVVRLGLIWGTRIVSYIVRAQTSKWTSEFPPELITAAAEEEPFLTSKANKRKKENSSGSSASGRCAAREREREREERRQSGKHRSLLGLTSTTPRL